MFFTWSIMNVCSLLEQTYKYVLTLVRDENRLLFAPFSPSIISVNLSSLSPSGLHFEMGLVGKTCLYRIQLIFFLEN